MMTVRQLKWAIKQYLMNPGNSKDDPVFLLVDKRAVSMPAPKHVQNYGYEARDASCTCILHYEAEDGPKAFGIWGHTHQGDK